MSGYGAFRNALLGKPDVVSRPFCAICGARAADKHHVLQKGAGGSRSDADIPLMRLCGSGNADGCHGLVHAHVLHVYWDDAKGGWVFYLSPEPMGDLECWEANRELYLPVVGWEIEKQARAEAFGARGKGRDGN